MWLRPPNPFQNQIEVLVLWISWESREEWAKDEWSVWKGSIGLNGYEKDNTGVGIVDDEGSGSGV